MLEPPELWETVERRLAQPGALAWLLLLSVVGGFGGALASEIGVRVFTTDWHPVMGYAPQPDRDSRGFFLLWSALAIAPLIQGAVGASLLSLYRRPRRWDAALAVSVVGSIPLYLASLTLVWLPGILLFMFAFLISCSWWSDGARELLGINPSESADYVAAMLIASSAILFLFSAAW